MAMILSSLAAACASKLAGLIAGRIAAGLGVEGDVRSMQRRMERVIGAVAEAERHGEGSAAAAWLEELRDFLYDADDILDLCRCRGGRLLADGRPRSGAGGPLVALNLLSSVQRLQARFVIGAQIRRLNGRFEEICKDRLFLGLAVDDPKAEDGVARGAGRVRARTSTPLLDTNVVGKEIKSATDELVEAIMRDDGHGEVEVVAVVGMGGIGKTTLAQRVFNSRRIAGGFPVRAWLCISREYSEADTVKEAIRCCGGDYGRAETLAELHPILRSTVSGKRFFLVLDDVWDAGVWTSLLRLPFHGATGRVLITTRDQGVAAKAGAGHSHQVRHLTAHSGWELLYRTACLDADEIQSLRSVGMAIVAKCGFLPIAVKVIGGLLMTKRRSRAEWERVLGSDAWSMAKLPEEFKGAIFLSYDDLPSRLKQCFLYFSLFPVDFVYWRCHICRQWVAEGFVTESGESTMEELAEECYYELITRSILQPHPGYLADQSRSTVHDVLRSFAQHLSRRESVCGDLQAVNGSSPLVKLRRLSLMNLEEVTTPCKAISDSCKCLRTLFLISIQNVNSRLMVRFSSLRTLFLSDCGINKIPESIGDLMHLRYLGFESVNIQALPESISQLRNLQFLNVKRCILLNALPRTLSRIHSLRRLGIEETPIRLVPEGIGRLHSLVDLQGFIVTSASSSSTMQQGWILAELESLSQLRWLRIDNLERAAIDTGASLDNKRYLKRLELSCTVKPNSDDNPWDKFEVEKIEAIFEKLLPANCLQDLLIRGFFGRRFPTWMESSSLCNVTWLKLVDCKFCPKFPPLGQLPHLTFLKIVRAESIVSVGSEFYGQGGGSVFPKLEFLWIGKMPKWEDWTLQITQETCNSSVQLLPCLRQLELKDCPKLRALPEQLKHAKKMQKLRIEGAHALNKIENFPELSGLLRINGSHCLASISDLYQIKELYVADCPALQVVNNLNALKWLYLEDESMEHVPMWLSRLAEKGEPLSEDGLELELHCSTAMLDRCLMGHQDWTIMKRFTSVAAYCKEAYMCYSRHPVSYHTSKNVSDSK
ncbi:putative disease resistance protein RGA4 [Oryza brachyantha]|uniref:putative disease resistance protein RGA4 n=1 Tax=Oryza brachyantha TaxID=4533 RepID=UPI001AD9F2B3|nr:putative disease resistance protein RGA4 [Oryza brachyantha]